MVLASISIFKEVRYAAHSHKEVGRTLSLSARHWEFAKLFGWAKKKGPKGGKGLDLDKVERKKKTEKIDEKEFPSTT